MEDCLRIIKGVVCHALSAKAQTIGGMDFNRDNSFIYTRIVAESIAIESATLTLIIHTEA